MSGFVAKLRTLFIVLPDFLYLTSSIPHNLDYILWSFHEAIYLEKASGH
ncbi:hypothetical protein [Paenibacillus sp. N3.4]|nr:hypothetical protein [Paenibacillus sp. N3.4]